MAFSGGPRNTRLRVVTVSATSGGLTDVGRVRQRNEDAILARAPVFAVADGMGGHDAGHVASALVVAGLQHFEGASAVDAQSVVAAIREVNREIRQRAASRGTGDVIGTTVVGLAFSRDEAADALFLFNVGDSRAYRLRENHFVQLSADHSLVAELVRRGELTETEARVDHRRNVVTRALGVDDVVDIDEWLLKPEIGDRYLMCSDGLTSEVSDEMIAELLAVNDGAADAATALVNAALDAGGRDNVSVVIVDIDDVGHSMAAVDADTDPRPELLLDTDATR